MSGIPDPVRLARQRLAELERAGTAARAAVLRRLRPSHGHALCRAEHDSPAFTRLVLEESRWQALTHHGVAVGVARAALAAACEPGLPELTPAGARQLRGLALAHLADARRGAGELCEAERLFLQAEEELGSRSDPEIGATFWELRSDLARACGQHHLELYLLRQAEELLENCEIPGRQGESLVRQATILLRFGGRPAAVMLRRALLEIEAQRYPRLRLEALHQLVAAEVGSGRYREARGCLTEAAPLYAAWADPVLLAQRCWLEGVTHLGLGEHAAAAAPLRESVDRLRGLGSVLDTAMALTDLGRLYVLAQRHGDLRALLSELVSLLRSPERARLRDAQLREIHRIATKKGLLAIGFSEFREQLEPRPQA